MASLNETLGLARSIAIYYGRPWKTRAARRFYSAMIRPGDLVFDIGAHVGSRSRVFSKLGAHVVAVEPQPLFFRFLTKTQPANVILRDYAVGAQAGEANLHISSRHPTVSTLSADWIDGVRTDPGFGAVNWDGTHRVKVTTLDAMIAEHGLPRFCKIDVEGFEADVLRGLSRPIPCIAFEYLPAVLDRAETCVNLIAQLGDYRFNRVRGESFTFASRNWVPAATMIEHLKLLRSSRSSGDIYARLVA
ncbi:FkbM family methyltransferase [Flaviflagellibacter deserti]|uniref:FkbM family methyltransferase n=1 Tax=Flaviflagellibacter deserti TaxID=2267266 RepID=A0ABV9Z111_9HYPH